MERVNSYRRAEFVIVLENNSVRLLDYDYEHESSVKRIWGIAFPVEHEGGGAAFQLPAWQRCLYLEERFKGRRGDAVTAQLA